MSTEVPSWADIIARRKYDGAWYVFSTFDGSELRAKDWLRAHGAECYYPVAPHVTVPDTWVPVLTGYVFARFEGEPVWMQIREANNGVIAWANSCHEDPETYQNVHEPFAIKDEIIEDIKRREAKGEFKGGEELAELIKATILFTKVRIPCGPFIDKWGKVVAVEGDLIRIRVKLLGSYSHLSFTVETLFPDGISL